MEDENLAGELTMSLGGLLREVSSIAWRCQIVLDRTRCWTTSSTVSR